MENKMKSQEAQISAQDFANGVNETQRQMMYIEKAKKHVEALAQKLGRKPTCCVTTFGCPMLLAPETIKTA